MLSILKSLFGFKPQPAIEPQKQVFSKNIEPLIVDREEEIPKNIEPLIVNRGEEIPKNKWYRMSHWKTQQLLRIGTEWNMDWRCFAHEEAVAGVSFEERYTKFLRLYDQPGFKIYLEKDPSNEYDSNAIKVMSSAMINGKTIVEQLGFLSEYTAQQLKDEKELDARPYSVYLPGHDVEFGLRISILVRSKRYRDKTYGKSVSPVPKFEWEPPPWTEEDEENLELIYDQLEDKDFRKDNNIKKPSKKLIKQAVQMLRDERLTTKNAVNQVDRVIEKLIEINPDLEIEY